MTSYLGTRRINDPGELCEVGALSWGLEAGVGVPVKNWVWQVMAICVYGSWYCVHPSVPLQVDVGQEGRC